jgi:V/A-type H+-transporting ATPase subunit B
LRGGCGSPWLNAGIAANKTRDDHRAVADQLYAALARGRDLRRLVSIIGEAALSECDRSYLAFAQDFEQSFVNQGATAGASRRHSRSHGRSCSPCPRPT